MINISDEFYQHCKKCSELCKEFIEKSKELLRVCQFVTIPAKCDIDINNVILVSDDLLASCEQVMDHAQVQMGSCDTKECKQFCEKLTFASKECIKALGNVELDCEIDLTPCVEAVSVAIDKAKECMNIIEEIL